MKPSKASKASKRTQQTRKKPGREVYGNKEKAVMNALQGFFYSSKEEEGKYIKNIYSVEGGETNPSNPHNPARSICGLCDLVALDSKGREVPMNHPTATGVAYREPPRHGGRSRKAPLCPLPKGMDAPWRRL